MTRSAPLSQRRPSSSQGKKRKGKPVESLMLELERSSSCQDEGTGAEQSLDLTAIQQIADGVEQMVFSWGLQKQERGQEYTELSKSLGENSPHVPLLPWNLNETEKLILDSASESGALVTSNGEPQGAGTKRAPSERAESERSGSRLRDCFDRTSSVSPSVTASENAQSLRAGNSPQAVKGSSRVRNCTDLKRLGGMTPEFEDSPASLRAVTPEQEINGGSCAMEIGKDNCMDGDTSIPAAESVEIAQKGDDGNDSCLASVWTPEAEAATPNTLERSQQSTMDQISLDQYPPSILTGDRAGNASPLLSQSPLCVQYPSPRPEAAQSSEIISSDANHGEVLASLGDLSMGLPINENGPERLTPLLPLLHATPSCGDDTESVEVGGHTIKVTALRGGTDVLEDKFQALVNINACSLGVQEEHQLKPSPTSDVEEMQIALLECAMEYEIKTIEAKMKMQELKFRGQQNVGIAKSCAVQPCNQKVIEPGTTSERTVDHQRLQQLKKQMMRLQHEKDGLSDELHALRDKERQFERQKRSLEDALLRVNRLQREVMKKEHDVVEWQLKEKETKAQLQEVGEKLKRERHVQSSLPLDPKKLLKLLPAIREWLRSLKKVGLAKAEECCMLQEKGETWCSIYPYTMEPYDLQPPILHSRDKGGISGAPARVSLLGELSEELAHQSNPTLSVNLVDKVICCLTKEIHALQKELNKLARG